MKKITCRQAQLWFTFLLDGVSLEDKQKIQLENHLKACAICQPLYREIKVIDETIKINMEVALKSHITSQKLGEFLDGEIDSELEQKIIRIHLNECDQCRHIYEKLTQLNALTPEYKLRTREFVIKHKLKTWIRIIIRHVNLLFSRHRLKIATALAALVIIFSFVIYQRLQQPASLAELTDLSLPPYIKIETRGVKAKYDQLQREGMNYYLNQQYNLAIEKLSKLVNSDSSRTMAQFYLGICYLRVEDLTKAEKQLKAVSSSPLFQVLANWYLAQLYLKKEDRTEALTALERVIALKKEPYLQKARKLKKRILRMKDK